MINDVDIQLLVCNLNKDEKYYRQIIDKLVHMFAHLHIFNDGVQYVPIFHIYHSSNYSLIVEFTSTGTTLYDMQIAGNTLFISIDNSIRQYSLFTGTLFVNQITQSNAINAKLIYLDGIGKVLSWHPAATQFYFYSYTENYECIYANNCTCAPNFCFDSTFTICNYNANLTCPYVPVPPALTPVQPAVLPPALIPTLPMVVPEQNSSTCFLQGIYCCLTFCSDECKSCSKDMKTCDQCISFYSFNENGKCQLNPKLSVLLTFISLFSTFRMNNAQIIFLFIEQLQFYNYHLTEYNGIIQQVLETADLVESQMWKIIPQSAALDWISKPFPLPSYNIYTNPKFLEVERKDSIFFQNIKTFIIIYMPFTIVSFFLLNKLFYLLFNFKISSLLRSYSLWLYLGFMIGNQNIATLSFLAIRDFQNTFSNNSQMYFVKAVQIMSYGILLVVTLSLFPLSSYLYGKVNKIFLTNIYRVKYAILLSAIRFTLKPFIQSLIHAFFYDQPVIQLYLLMLLHSITLLFMLFLEMYTNIFVKKMLFAIQSLIQLNIVFLNFFIYAKYYVYPELNDILEQILRHIIYIFIGLGAITFIISTLLTLFHKKLSDKTLKVTRKNDRNARKLRLKIKNLTKKQFEQPQEQAKGEVKEQVKVQFEIISKVLKLKGQRKLKPSNSKFLTVQTKPIKHHNNNSARISVVRLQMKRKNRKGKWNEKQDEIHQSERNDMS